MATTIVTKSGDGAPTASDLVAGELAVDLTNGRLYTEDSGGTVLELGLNPNGNVNVTGSVTTTGSVGIGGVTGERLTVTAPNPTDGLVASLRNSGTSDLTGTKLWFNQNTVDNWNIGQPAGVNAFVFCNSTGSTAERLRIDASGNVGIGTSSTGFNGQGLPLVVGSGTGNTGMTIFSGADSYGTLQFADAATTGAASYAGVVSYNHTSNFMYFSTASTERMRIDASGNVGIGVVPSAWWGSAKALQIAGSTGFLCFNGANGNITTNTYYDGSNYRYLNNAGAFLYEQSVGHKWSIAAAGTTGNIVTLTQAMTLDASGNLLVGKTAANFTVLGAELRNNGQINSASAYDFLNMYSTSAAAYRFYVTNAGQINATSTSISAISDQRFKENIRDLDDGLSKVMQLKPRKFDWKEGKGADTKNARGFIAQEFEEVFPDLIGEWKDPAPEGEEPYKSVSQDLIPTLVKAIQEQQATIEALTARIAALES